jgi:acyl carrier protein
MTVNDPRSDEILDIVAKETGVDRERLTPDAVLSDLDIPSLDLVQTIFAIEERYKVDIPVVSERTGAEFQTVGDLVQHVLATLEAAPVQPRPGAG